jgi:hypothetical protein
MPKKPARPLINYRIEQLEAIFADHPSSQMLSQLLRELKERRQWGRAGELRSAIERELGRSNSIESGQRDNEALPSSTISPLVSGDGTSCQTGFESAFSSDPGVVNTTALDGDAEPDEDKIDGEATDGAAVAGHHSQQPLLFLDEDLEETVPPTKERRAGRMRAPGPLPDVPAKWTPEPKKDLVPTWKSEDPPLSRYEGALRALIDELRKRIKIGQQIQLQDGCRVTIDGEDAAYQFVWTGDEDLFEGADVKAIADGRPATGRLVSITPQQLTVTLDDDFGHSISQCTLFVDNTAMLEALANRLKDIAEKKPASFNLELAEDAVTNRSEESPVAEVSPEFLNGLRQLQARAVRMAAGNRVTYLWGPPGTGKTRALSAMARHFSAAEKKILVASNTNQAVDQVLRQLCDALTEIFPPEQVELLEQGKIVRIGKKSDELERYRKFVTIDGIVERRSGQLHQRKAELESEERALVARNECARAVVTAFRFIDEAGQQRTTATANLSHAHRALDQAKQAQQRIETKKTAFETELSETEQAGGFRRLFKRSPETIRADIAETVAALAAGVAALEAGGQRVESLKREEARLERLIRDAEAIVAGQDYRAAEAETEKAEERLAEIRRNIAEIERQLSDIEASVLANAKVIGATATKLFLSPNSFAGFDVVILDEASMLPLPALFHAAGLAKESVVISGDFRQLPPIILSEQEALRRELGKDVFHVAGIEEDVRSGRSKRMVMLEEQFRMAEPVCRLVSLPMYNGRLWTADEWRVADRSPPNPFLGPLTIVDTSYIGPVVAKDPAGSKFNLMNALIVRNICRHLSDNGFGEAKDVGVIVPYAAQRKLLRRILNDAGLEQIVAGTVHRYQGDEKRLIVIDLTDGIGLKLAGLWFQANTADDDGAKLFNVAITRARYHLVFVGDLAWLDRKLPERAFLRDWLHQVQETGRVVDVREVMGLLPAIEDLRKYGVPFSVSAQAEETGLFNERDFDQVIRLDLSNAKQGIAIWSAFVTPQRIAHYADILRMKVQESVPVRCIVRPPWDNGSMGEVLAEEAIDALVKIGCVVDTRLRMHEKAIIIDDEIVWFGSLNPLSHTGNTGEMMARFEGRQAALQITAFLSVKGTGRTEQQAGAAYQGENPACGCGETKAVFARGRFGPYWRCLKRSCDWKSNDNHPKRATTGPRPTTRKSCPKCGGSLVARVGSRGWFFGCSRFPNCDGVISVDKLRSRASRKAGEPSRASTTAEPQ